MDALGNLISVAELLEVSEKLLVARSPYVGQGKDIPTQAHLYLEGRVGMTKKFPNNTISAPMIL